MGYFLRYITTEADPPALATLRAALQEIDAAYRLISSPVDEAAGDLFYGDLFCGELEINRTGDDLFEEDLGELRLLVGHARGEQRERVLRVLDAARALIIVSAVWQGGDPEPVLNRIDPLWDWLFPRYAGLLQADGEGFYDENGLVLELRVKM
jgi:hypothetical protein